MSGFSRSRHIYIATYWITEHIPQNYMLKIGAQKRGHLHCIGFFRITVLTSLDECNHRYSTLPELETSH